MKKLVIYDTLHENTKRLAEVIAETLSSKAQSVTQVDPTELSRYDLVLVGSPTQGGRSTKAIDTFLQSIPENSLEYISVASFDTRFAPDDHRVALRLLMKLIGYSAPKISSALIAKGGNQIVEPAGFIVDDTKGPLKSGEIERAIDWATLIQNKLVISD